jgi:hypothetical protein
MMQFGKANALVQCMLVICATLNVRFWSFEFGMLLFIWGGPFGRADELFFLLNYFLQLHWRK